MNMPNKRGPKPKKVQLYYDWDQIPLIADQGLVCNLFGISLPTLRKWERAGRIKRIQNLANPPEDTDLQPLVRYKKRDLMVLAEELLGEDAV